MTTLNKNYYINSSAFFFNLMLELFGICPESIIDKIIFIYRVVEAFKMYCLVTAVF